MVAARFKLTVMIETSTGRNLPAIRSPS